MASKGRKSSQSGSTRVSEGAAAQNKIWPAGRLLGTRPVGLVSGLDFIPGASGSH